MKSNLLKAFLLALIAALTPQLANAYYFIVDGIAYNTSYNTTVEVTSGGNYIDSINIPSSVTYIGNTYRVTSISNSAFSGCTKLTSVTIPNSVTTIGSQAFYYCTGLTSVTIPNSVTTINEGTFKNCTGLTSVNIPNSVTTIGNYAFSGCTGLTSVNIPNSVTTIGKDAFSLCDALASVTIPNSVTSIGGSAFMNCTSLTTVTIPNSVKSIGGSAFNSCTGLTTMTIPNSVESIGDYLFNGCTGLTSVIIGNSVTSIGAFTFQNCTALNSVTIGNSVTAIYKSAFVNCSELNTITIPNSVKTIDETVFWGCNNLVSVTLGSSVTSIGKKAFYECVALKSVEIPNQVTSIGVSAFEGCTSLTSAIIGNAVKTIGDNAFQGCTSLTSVDLPNSVTTIGVKAFYNCSGLTSVIIGNSVTTIKVSAFEGCSNMASVSIGNKVTTIEEKAFSHCSSLTSLTIPNSVTSIGNFAFEHCGLVSVIIGNNVTSIGNWAFQCCSGLFFVSIPSRISSIGIGAFYLCRDLLHIYCHSLHPVSIDYQTFTNYDAGANLYVEYAPYYTNYYPWNLFNIIVDAVHAESLTLSSNNMSIEVGETITLTANIMPYYTTNRHVIWTSSNKTVATVDQNGNVTAKATGNAIITARTMDGSNLTDTCLVTAHIKATSIILDHSKLSLIEGRTHTLVATVTPDNATNGSVTWESSDTIIATVDQNGKVIAKSPGNAIITSRTTDGSNLSATCQLTVAHATDAVTVIIGEGEVEDEKLPIYNEFKYTFTGTECLYLKDQLVGLRVGDKITAIAFYCKRNKASGGNFNIRLKNTSISSLKDNADKYDTSCIEVSYYDQVNGNVTLGSYYTGQWVSLPLSTPFVYGGKNIIIDIRNTEPAYNNGKVCWFANTTYYDTRRSLSWLCANSENPHDDGFWDGGISNYENSSNLPNIRITYFANNDTIPGDVNGDGVVTAADITALYDCLLNNDNSHIVNGDQTGDGIITAADITAVYSVMLENGK